MAGHSKWANIKHRKAAKDAKKGKITTRLVKEIAIAARIAGGDPNSNPRLRLAMEKARENNIPKDNVDRAVKRGIGGLEGVNYEEIRFEGYGINGIGVIVDCLTDNKIRTVSEVRHAFTKHGGNLGTNGCVVFQFNHCGQFVFAPDENNNKLIDLAIEFGAIDVVENDDKSVEILTNPDDFIIFKDKFTALGFKAIDAEVTMRPNAPIEIYGDDAVKMQKMIDAFDEIDDVQEVYLACDINLPMENE